MRLFILIHLVFASSICQSQISIAIPDSLLVGLAWNHLSGYSYSDSVLHVDSVIFTNTLSKWLECTAGMPKHEKKIETNWTIGMDNFYASGQSLSYFGGGLYTNLSLEDRALVFGLPIRISGSLVVQKNKINSRLSALSVELDYERFIDNLREKIRHTMPDKAFRQITIEKQNLLLNHFLFEQIDSLRTCGAYQKMQSDFLRQIDSLEFGLKNQADSTKLDSLRQQVQKMENQDHNLDSIYTVYLKQSKEVQSTLLELQQSVLKKWQELEEKAELGQLGELAKEYPEIQKWESVFSSISKLNIGSFRVTGSPFDISSIPIHGASVEWKRNGFYASANYGWEGRQKRTLPDYIQNLRLSGEGRKVTYLKAGIGMPEKSHLHLSFSHIQVPGTTNDTIYPSFSKRNVLISLDSRYAFSRFYFDITGSLSNADFTGKAKTGELLREAYNKMIKGAQNLACQARAGWKSSEGKTDINIAYQVVGNGFATLGNLFLLKNRNTIRLDGKHRFWQDRVQLKISYVQGTSNSQNDLYPGIHQSQFSGDLSFRLNKRGSRVWATYSPNYYLQNAGGASNTTIYELNLATLGAHIVYPPSKNGQWMTLLQATNFADQTQYGDTSTVSGLWYGMVMQTWSSEKYSFTAASNIGVDRHNAYNIKDLSVDIQQSFDWKQLQISQGAQVVKRYFDSGLLAGGSAGLQINTKRKIRFGVNMTYLLGLSSNTQDQYFLNTAIGWQF